MPIRSGLDADNIALSQHDTAIRILDQSLLPHETRYLELRHPQELHEAIVSLRVRGAPALGIFGAFALYVLASQHSFGLDTAAFLLRCQQDRDFLNTSRPTAVNLSKMLDRVLHKAQCMTECERPVILEAMKQEALTIQAEDIVMCQAISEYGLRLIKDGDAILTHCNAGPLATSRYGTALGPIFLAKERAISLHVFCDETRPLLQGARLTTYELQSANIPCTLICDNMASLVMQEGKISACFVGCDRIARNGDTANKIGTSGLAILANYYHIPFYVLGPSSTIDFSCPSGKQIPIEVRPESEVKEAFFAQPSAPSSVHCYNPAFDVTPHTLISAIVTERGISYPPFDQSFSHLFPEAYQENVL